MEDEQEWWGEALQSFAMASGAMPQDAVADALISWASDVPTQQDATRMFKLVEPSPEFVRLEQRRRAIVTFAAVMSTMISAQRLSTVLSTSIVIPRRIPFHEFVRTGTYDRACRAAARAVRKWAAQEAGLTKLSLTRFSVTRRIYHTEFQFHLSEAPAALQWLSIEATKALVKR